MVDFRLSPQQENLKEKARKFALEEVLPYAWYYDELGVCPKEILKKAGEWGLMNADIPRKYGGLGLSSLDIAVITEEIAAACPGIATSIFDNSLGMEPLLLSHKEDLKRKYLPKILREDKFMCFAVSEPGMGSDVAGLKCRARETEEGYILTGTKYWITNGGLADYATLFATVDPKAEHLGIIAFLVDLSWHGVRRGIPIEKLGQRTSNTVGLSFKDVFVPRDHVLATAGEGFLLAMKTFQRTRPIIGAFSVGAARSALDHAIHYVKKRKAFNSRLSRFQAIQHKIAKMYMNVETTRLIVWKAAWEADQNIKRTVSASISKLYASEAAMEVVNDALQLFGGFGYTKTFPIEKLLRDIRLFSIYEGTSEIQRSIIASHALGAYKPTMPPLEKMPMQRISGKLDENTTIWRCSICGYIYEGEEPPDECPQCFYRKGAFEKIMG